MITASSTVLPRRRSLTMWALFAVFMVVTSYVVAILIAITCFSLVLAWSNSFLLAAGGVILGITILWSLIPRRDKLQPPAAALQRSRHPRLFAELDRIAASLDEDMPNEVYLTPEVNAWVAERGGIVGAGSRKVMGIGLPLLGVFLVWRSSVRCWPTSLPITTAVTRVSAHGSTRPERPWCEHLPPWASRPPLFRL